MNALESLKFFLPETLLLAGAFAVFVLDFFISNKKSIGWAAISILILAAFLCRMPTEPLPLFFGFFYLDSFAHFFRYIALGIVGVTIFLSLTYRPLEKKFEGEYYGLFLFMTLGLILMAASNHLLMIFLSIEFVSLLSYLLVGFLKRDQKSKEAAMKYFLFGSVASAIMLYGMSLLYGVSGSLDLPVIAKNLNYPAFKTISLAGASFFFVGLGFKISMVPCHMWAPDTYEGAPTPVTAFLTVAPKALGFAVLIRVLATLFMAFWKEWSVLFMVLSILTMTLGNITAISQTNIKRFLAYSSIAQAGYLLMGIAVFSQTGKEALLLYLLAYIVANLGAFTAVIMVSGKLESDTISDYAGLSRRSPALAAFLTVFLLSLTGIPPLAGFIGKYYVFASAIEAGFITLAVAAIINSAIAAYYYFKVIRVMYLENASQSSILTYPKSLTLMLWIMGLLTLLMGLAPQIFISFIETLSIF